MLVDLNRVVRSDLVIMDGIYGMQGNGPRNGTLVNTGVLIFSKDPAAVDATAARIMGFDPEKIMFLKIAEEFGLGNISEKKIDITGEPLESFQGTVFEKSVHTDNHPLASPNLNIIKNLIIPKPVISEEKCVKCNICVRVCPVKPKALSGTDSSIPVYDYNRCIRCYCCQEMCPEGAITIKVPLLGKIFHGLGSRF